MEQETKKLIQWPLIDWSIRVFRWADFGLDKERERAREFLLV